MGSVEDLSAQSPQSVTQQKIGPDYPNSTYPLKNLVDINILSWNQTKREINKQTKKTIDASLSSFPAWGWLGSGRSNNNTRWSLRCFPTQAILWL